MRIARSEGHARGTWILIPRRSEAAAQIDEAFDHRLRRLQDPFEFGLPHARTFRTTQVVAEQQFVQWSVCQPGPGFLQRNLALHPILRPRRHLPRQYASNGLRVVLFAIVMNQRKAGITKLIEIPQITCATILTKPHDEQIVAAALNEGTLVVFCQKPDIRPPIWWFVSHEELLLDLLGFDIDQVRTLIVANDFVTFQRVTGRAIASAKSKR